MSTNKASVVSRPKPGGGKVATFALNAHQLKAIEDFQARGATLDCDMDAFLLLAIEVKAIFAAKPRGAKIEGCSEFYEFVEKVFKKSARTVRSWLAAEGLTDQRYAKEAKPSVGLRDEDDEREPQSSLQRPNNASDPALTPQTASPLTAELTVFYTGFTTKVTAFTKFVKSGREADDRQKVETLDLVRAMRTAAKDLAERADRLVEVSQAQ